MCTVSIVPTGTGFSLMCNRDEKRTRPMAVPPRRWCIDGIDGTFPIDPASGGTWVGVNEHGLAIALLNRTDSPRPGEVPRTPPRSRGEVVPGLIGARGLSQVAEKLRATEADAHAPFRVVAARRGEVLVATSDGKTIEIAIQPLTEPTAFTSSSLGDALAEQVRLPLFETLVRRSTVPIVDQRRFHDHRWADCPAFSVRMRRGDTWTVSRSRVTTDGGRVRFEYEQLSPL